MTIPKLQFGQWATAEALYPSSGNPWSTQPVSVAPVGDIFTPNTKPGAQTLNFMFNAIGKDLVTMRNMSLGAALENWHAPVTASGLLASASWTVIAWDDAHQMWVGGISDGTSNGRVLTSTDGITTWTSRSTVLVSPCALASNASTIVAYDAGSGGTGANAVTKITSAGNTVTAVPDLQNRNIGTAWWSAADSIYYLYVAHTTGGAGITVGTLISTPNGTTLTQLSVPTGWGANASTLTGFDHAQSPSFALVVFESFATGNSLVAKVAAGVMTNVTPAIVSAQFITGVAYDAVNALWLLQAHDGTNSHVYSSSDASTWTLRSTFAGLRAEQGITAAGGAWVTLLPSQTPFETGAGGGRPWISMDQGATWTPTTAKIEVLNVASLLRSGGNRVAHMSSIETQISFAIN